MKTNFHNKNFALNLAFMRFKATRKWSIALKWPPLVVSFINEFFFFIICVRDPVFIFTSACSLILASMYYAKEKGEMFKAIFISPRLSPNISRHKMTYSLRDAVIFS